MATDRTGTPSPDPLVAALMEEASRAGAEDLDLDAFEEIVEAAVAPFAEILTPEALHEARAVAAVAVVSSPDAAQIAARHRARRPVPESSGTRPKQSPEALLDAARRRRDRLGGKGAS